MMLSRFLMSTCLRRMDLFRHVLAGVLAWFAWRFLSIWYQYQNPRDYWSFAALCFPLFAIAGWPFLRARIRASNSRRLLIAGLLLVVALPWAEWFHFSTTATRENWTQQIFLQGLLLYAFLAIFFIFPEVPKWICRRTVLAIHVLASRDWILWLPPLLFFLFTSFISVFVFKEVPILPDSASHLFQAKILRHLRLFAPAPPFPDLFTGPLDLLAIKDGRWFGIYQPGLSLLLAAAMPLHAEWVVAPMLGALTIAIWIAYARRWHNRWLAFVLGWLCLFSPFLLLMSSNIMVHTPELFVCSVVIYLCRRRTEEEGAWWLAVLFAVLMWGVLVRPHSIFPFLAPSLAFTFWHRFHDRDYAFLLVTICGITLGGLLLMAYQSKTTGNPFVPGYVLEFPDPPWGFGEHHLGHHTPAKGLENTSNNLLGLNYWLTGWYSGSLIFLIAFFLKEPKLQHWDRILLLNCCGLILFYFFLFFQDLWFGPRYWYPLAPFLLLLVARGAFGSQWNEQAQERPAAIALLVLSLVSFLPFRLLGFIQRYNPSQTQSGRLKEEIRKLGNKKVLVFLDPDVSQNFVSWNDPFLKGPVILCRDVAERQNQAIATFSGYSPVYFHMEFGYGRNQIDTGFHFYQQPYRRPPGAISLFQLAASVMAGNQYPDKDCFDITYVDLFNSDEPASMRLLYLQNEENKMKKEKDGYQKSFHLGLIHVAKMLLLPQFAFEGSGRQWAQNFDIRSFRKEYEMASKDMAASGEVGKSISVELEKVKRRVDQNRDGTMSDPEIIHFLSDKVLVIIGGGSL